MCVFLCVYLFMVCAVGEEVRDQCYPPLYLALLMLFLRVALALPLPSVLAAGRLCGNGEKPAVLCLVTGIANTLRSRLTDVSCDW